MPSISCGRGKRLPKQRYKAEFYLLLCALIWGATFLIVKNGLLDASPLLLISIRFGLAAIIFLPLSFASLVRLDRNGLTKGVILGVLLFAGFATQTIGLKYTTASKSGFITGLLVVFTPFLQMLIERRPPNKGNVIGVSLVAVGLYLLTSPTGAGFNVGDALTLLCAIIFAIYIVYLDVFSKQCNISQLTFLQMLVTVILAYAGSFLFEQRYLRWTPQLLMAVGYLAILATVVTLYVQTRYQKHTTPTRAAIIFSLEPVIAAIIAYWFGNERIGLWGVLGGLIVVGLLVSELSDEIFSWFRPAALAGRES
jgi:drug/metabolite transporter (DMT)-like permease